jgi:hypothetical protein
MIRKKMRKETVEELEAQLPKNQAALPPPWQASSAIALMD